MEYCWERDYNLDRVLQGEERKVGCYMDSYRDIDMKKTGENLKKIIHEKGFRVCEIQQALCLSCPQPIYRWFKGQILPSVNHLFVLSKLLDVHMEELLVEKKQNYSIDIEGASLKCVSMRMQYYFENLIGYAA